MPPVLQALVGALAGEFDHAALSRERTMAVTPSFRWPLQAVVHALAGGDAQRQRDRERRFALGLRRTRSGAPGFALAHGDDAGPVFPALAVEQIQRVARLQAQHRHRMVSGGFGQRDFRAGREG